jgi:hypothetical protein
MGCFCLVSCEQRGFDKTGVLGRIESALERLQNASHIMLSNRGSVQQETENAELIVTPHESANNFSGRAQSAIS